MGKRPRTERPRQGDRFGTLTVLGPAPKRPGWLLCRCDCGAAVSRQANYLRNAGRSVKNAQGHRCPLTRLARGGQERRQAIVEAFFGGEPAQDVARRFGVSRSRVYQVVQEEGRARGRAP